MSKSFEEVISSPLIRMGASNILATVELDQEMRLGLYYIAECYHLGLRICTHGAWEWVEICKGEKKVGLSGNEIIDMSPDMEILRKHKSDYERGIFPKGYKSNEKEKKPAFLYANKYGWLSPDGDFTVCGWGMHEEKADEIIEKHQLGDWEMDFFSAREYLDQVHGYCLLNSPGLDGVIVSHTKPLTQQQREFLHDYFMGSGNNLRAQLYLNGGDENA